MKVIVCDRCDRKIGQTSEETQKFELWRGGYKRYDLCPECQRELEIWLNEKHEADNFRDATKMVGEDSDA